MRQRVADAQNAIPDFAVNAMLGATLAALWTVAHGFAPVIAVSMMLESDRA
jgi:hypothetical protein